MTVSSLPYSCSENTIKTGVIAVSSAVAIVGIALIAIGLLSHYQVLTGLNLLTEKALIGVGIGISVIGTAVSSVSYFSMAREYTSNFSSYDEVFKELKGCIEQGKNPLASIQKLAKQLPYEQLQEFVQTKYPSHKDALLSAKHMVRQANEYCSLREGISPSMKTRVKKCTNTLVNIIDSILLAFGVADFFKPAESELQGEFKFQKILMLLSLFTLLTATLLPMLGVTTGASIVGGLMLLICIMSLIWPHMRPRPTRLPEGKNWTMQVREGKIKPVQGRDEKVLQIADALNARQHPLLIGPSGVGKTQTVRAFVHAIEKGQFPELKGKVVFYFNTANLVTSKEIFNGGNKILKRISDALGRHRHNCILVFDEIHLAYKIKESESAIGEQLKTYLDEAENNFPHVIGLTTSEEYYRDIYSRDKAGDRRFRKIEIESMDEKATATILNQFLIQKAPDAIVERGALDYIIEETQGLPQPMSAQHILSQCINELSLSKESSKSEKIEKQRTSILNACTRNAVLGSSSIEDERAESGEDENSPEDGLDRLEKELNNEKEDLHKLGQFKKKLVSARDAKYRLAKQVSSFDAGSLSTRKKTKIGEFILLKYFLERALEEVICSKGNALIETKLNKELVCKVLDKHKRNEAQRQEVLKREEELARRQVFDTASTSKA